MKQLVLLVILVGEVSARLLQPANSPVKTWAREWACQVRRRTVQGSRAK
jgi:hypothetical protein